MGLTLSERMKHAKLNTACFLNALIHMQRRISSSRTSLPELMTECAAMCDGAVRDFFLSAAKELSDNRTQTAEMIFLQCLRTHDLCFSEQGIQACKRLFGSIGWMDGFHQTEALQRAIGEFELLEKQLCEEYRQRGRCGAAIGACAGLALMIILI